MWLGGPVCACAVVLCTVCSGCGVVRFYASLCDNLCLSMVLYIIERYCLICVGEAVCVSLYQVALCKHSVNCTWATSNK